MRVFEWSVGLLASIFFSALVAGNSIARAIAAYIDANPILCAGLWFGTTGLYLLLTMLRGDRQHRARNDEIRKLMNVD